MNVNKFCLIVFFTSFFSFSQKKEITTERDYTILNKTLEHYFHIKRYRDSLDLVDLKVLEKKSKNSKEVKRIVKEDIKRIKKNDTVYIKIMADKFYYGQFLKKDASWKRKKEYYQFSEKLDSIFSENEVINYQKQLGDNLYFWNNEKINYKDRVFIINDLKFTRNEIKKMSEIERDKFNKKTALLEEKLNLYTFSKPIYSINKLYALIAYNRGGNNIIYIYKKTNKKWIIELVLSNNYLIDKLIGN